jgi:hypothetical protein
MLTTPSFQRAAIESFSLNAGRLYDRRPFGNFAPDQIGQRLWPEPFLIREVAAKIEQALARGLVIEGLVERSTQLVDDRLRCALGREQRVPSRGLEIWQPRFSGCRHIGESRIALGRADGIRLDGAALHLRDGVDDLVAHVVDLPSDERVHRRACSGVRNRRRYDAEDRVELETGDVRDRADARGRSRMRESRTYGSGRGACDETHVPTATAARVHNAARRRGYVAARSAGAADRRSRYRLPQLS